MTRPRSMMKSPLCVLLGDLYPCPAECEYSRCAVGEAEVVRKVLDSEKPARARAGFA